MSIQKSRKEYQGETKEQRIRRLFMDGGLERKCTWLISGDCEKSMPEMYKNCKGTCFAYIPYKSTK